MEELLTFALNSDNIRATKKFTSSISATYIRSWKKLINKTINTKLCFRLPLKHDVFKVNSANNNKQNDYFIEREVQLSTKLGKGQEEAGQTQNNE